MVIGEIQRGPTAPSCPPMHELQENTCFIVFYSLYFIKTALWEPPF